LTAIGVLSRGRSFMSPTPGPSLDWMKPWMKILSCRHTYHLNDEELAA
jgi:hypothetical protein